MRLYLVQHGDAVSRQENSERPLSDKGRSDVERLTALLARSRPAITRIIHSGKARAFETARIFARAIAPGVEVEEAAAGLAANDSTDLFFQAVANWRDDIDTGAEDAGGVMLVGHLPFMGKLASRLVTGVEDAAVAVFQPGGVLCLEWGGAAHGWSVAWMAPPELLGQ